MNNINPIEFVKYIFAKKQPLLNFFFKDKKDLAKFQLLKYSMFKYVNIQLEKEFPSKGFLIISILSLPVISLPVCSFEFENSFVEKCSIYPMFSVPKNIELTTMDPKLILKLYDLIYFNICYYNNGFEIGEIQLDLEFENSEETIKKVLYLEEESFGNHYEFLEGGNK